MNIVEKAGMFQLILPEQLVDDLDLKNEFGAPLVIVHGDPFRLEALYKNIELHHNAWIKMMKRLDLIRKRSLYCTIADFIFSVALFVATGPLAPILRVPARLLQSMACLIVVRAVFCYRKWKKVPKRGIPLLTPAIVELRQRIEQEYCSQYRKV